MPFESLERMLFATRDRVRVFQLLSSPSFPKIWRKLRTAKLLPQLEMAAQRTQQDRDRLAVDVLRSACFDAADFVDRRSWAQYSNLAADVSGKAKVLRRLLSDLPLDMLQMAAEVQTTMNREDVSKLHGRLAADLKTLAALCALESPRPTKIQPRKPNAPRAHATARAGFLGSEFGRMFAAPHWALISQVVNAIDDPIPPMTPRDVKDACKKGG